MRIIRLKRAEAIRINQIDRVHEFGPILNRSITGLLQKGKKQFELKKT